MVTTGSFNCWFNGTPGVSLLPCHNLPEVFSTLLVHNRYNRRSLLVHNRYNRRSAATRPYGKKIVIDQCIIESHLFATCRLNNEVLCIDRWWPSSKCVSLKA